MGAFLSPYDLEPFATIEPAKSAAMIEDAEAMAALAAPCIADPLFAVDTGLAGALRAVLRGAVLRWNEAGTGAIVQQQAGPFGQTLDTRQSRRSMFWPSEIEQLRDLCTRFNGASTGAFSVDMVQQISASHSDWCALYFGATYCSCGADIAGVPIFGV